MCPNCPNIIGFRELPAASGPRAGPPSLREEDQLCRNLRWWGQPWFPEQQQSHTEVWHSMWWKEIISRTPGYDLFCADESVMFLHWHTLDSQLHSSAPTRKIRIGGSRLLQIKGARSFKVKKGGSLSSIRRAGSLKSTKMSRQDSESENDAESDRLLSQSRDTVTDIGEKGSLLCLCCYWFAQLQMSWLRLS